MPEFDAYANHYQELVTQSVRLSGEPAEYFASYKARYLAQALRCENVLSVLDYGCGVGLLAESLCGEFPHARIDGFDLSADSIRRIRPSLRSRGTYADSLDELGTGYDLVVLSNVLHHVKPGERNVVLAQVASRVGNSRRIAVFEHNPLNPLTRWAVSQCEFDADAILLKHSEARCCLQEAGFEILRHDFVVFFPRWLSLVRPLEPLLHWCPGGAQYAIVGRKP